MKCFSLVTLALLAPACAYTVPTMATRAVGKKAGTRVVRPAKKAPAKKKVSPKKAAPKKVAPKKVAPKRAAPKKAAPKKAASKKVVEKKAPPVSKGYPSFASKAASVAFNVKTSGNAPPKGYKQPFYGQAGLQFERDPAVWAAAAQTRTSPLSNKNIDYAYDDGLTVIERTQRDKLPAFLTGSAKSQADVSTIREDLEADSLIFGLDPDRFQLLFITVFGLFTLVGCLSGTVQL